MNQKTDNNENLKHTSFGWIPEDWNNFSLSQVCDLIQDGTHFSPASKEGNYKYITSKNIRFGKLDLSNCEHISEEEHKQIYQRCPVKKGDILLTKDGAKTGNAAINNLDEEFSLLSSVAVLRSNKQIATNDFILQVILSSKMQRIIKDSMAGQAITRLTLEKIKGLQIPVPILNEQKKIAGILSTWDSAIETTEKLLTAKQTRKRALVQHLLTGKQRFPQFAGQAWREVQLGEIFNEIKATNDGGDTHSIMTISSRLGLISQQDKFYRVIAGDSLKKYTQIKQEDFAYNKGNSKTYQMGCIYQLEDRKSALVPFVYICFSPTEAVYSTFYKHWFFAHGLDRQLKKIITSGARGDGLLNVNTDDFFKLKVPFPPKEEQKAIAQVLESANTEINLLKKQLDALKNQKRGLMQKLLTGKVRVKIDAVEAMEA